MIFHIGLYLTVHLFIWSDIIIISWLGLEYIDALIPIKIITLSILPYLYFVILRNVLDAIEVKSIISNYLHIALFITTFFSLLSVWFELGAKGLTISFIVGIFFMGLMTSKRIYNDFFIDKSSLFFIKILSLNTLIVTFLFLIKIGYAYFITEPLSIFTLLVLEILFFIFYLYFINKMKSGWIKMITNRFIK